ncbi:MAG: outer membrane lipoprotein chaperone LolA [Acidobacteria bacterium]|nr:outer membrane lipoprotein chaperone LolA [Acidobacteriota bacterium]MBV9145426.1 outer membrane lipoprotein chaperone LolA [Acidobacteriota bacterium]
MLPSLDGRMIRLIVLCWVSASAISLGQSSVSEIASRVDARYNHLNTMRAHFQESYSGAGLSRNESGELWLQKPGKMRWQYEQPAEKLFIVDGKTAFFYVPSEHQARRMPAKKLDDLRSPIRYLLGHTKLRSEFNKLQISAEQSKQSGNVVLEGVPKGMEDRVQRVLLEIAASSEITRIRVEELDGSVTEFDFSVIEENVSVKAGLFHFSPPPGVEVVEGQGIEP